MRWSVVQRCTLFAVVNARWTTSNQKLLVLEPQWIKSTERAKRLLIPPIYSLRGIRAYDELQIFVTEVGKIKQPFTQGTSSIGNVLVSYDFSNTQLRTFLYLRNDRKSVKVVMSCIATCVTDVQSDSVARGPKPLSIKNYVIEIMIWKFIYTYRERCKTGPAHNLCWNWSPFTSKHTWMRFSKFWNTFRKFVWGL